MSKLARTVTEVIPSAQRSHAVRFDWSGEHTIAGAARILLLIVGLGGMLCGCNQRSGTVAILV